MQIKTLLIILFLTTTFLYSSHYEEKVKKLGLENCEDCHTTKAWNDLKTPKKFDHAKTGFDLGKQHDKLECVSCHDFKENILKKKECKDCHTDPHKNAFLKTDKDNKNCETCHKESIWHQTERKHEDFSKGYVLDGKHKDVSCLSCHKTENYSDVSNDCMSCHKTDYAKTKFPNHKVAKFSKSCETCHTTYGWSQGRYYEHESFFPILTSNHMGFSCRSCHNNQSDYKEFTCTTACHKKSKTERQHKNVAGYTYKSKSCYSCHPQGKR